jgi:hypothetical protein
MSILIKKNVFWVGFISLSVSCLQDFPRKWHYDLELWPWKTTGVIHMSGPMPKSLVCILSTRFSTFDNYKFYLEEQNAASFGPRIPNSSVCILPTMIPYWLILRLWHEKDNRSLGFHHGDQMYQAVRSWNLQFLTNWYYDLDLWPRKTINKSLSSWWSIIQRFKILGPIYMYIIIILSVNLPTTSGQTD